MATSGGVGEQTNLQINPPRSRSRSPTCVSELQVNSLRNPWDPRKNPYITRERLDSNKMGLTFYQDRPDIMVNRIT